MSNLEITKEFKWESPHDALLACRPLMTRQGTGLLESMKSTVEQCGYFMLHTIKAMEVAFVMAQHSDKFDKAAHDFDLENACLKDELQKVHVKLRAEELKGAKLDTKVRDLTREVGELKEMNRTFRVDLTRSFVSQDRLTEKVEKLEE